MPKQYWPWAGPCFVCGLGLGCHPWPTDYSQSWVVLSDVPPPASRCYANCGPLLIRPSVASALCLPLLLVLPLFLQLCPLLWKKKSLRRFLQLRSMWQHVDEELSSLRAELIEIRSKFSDDIRDVKTKVDTNAAQLQDLRSELSSVVSTALASALPSALSAALPSVLSPLGVPSPLRKTPQQQHWLGGLWVPSSTAGFCLHVQNLFAGQSTR